MNIDAIRCECRHLFLEHQKPPTGTPWDICSFPCSLCNCQEFDATTPPETPAAAMRAAEEVATFLFEEYPDNDMDRDGATGHVAAIITRCLPAAVSDKETSMNTVTFGDSKNIANPDVSCPKCGGTKPTCCSCPDPKDFSLAEFAWEFTQAAINAHVGFKHETRWHDCNYASCAKWREMIDTLNAAATTSPETTPNYALVQLLNAAMLHPEQAEGYIRRVIAELGDASPETPVGGERDNDVDYFDPVSLLEKAMRTTMEIECDCPREFGACDGKCVGTRVWSLIHRARTLIKVAAPIAGTDDNAVKVAHVVPVGHEYSVSIGTREAGIGIRMFNRLADAKAMCEVINKHVAAALNQVEGEGK